MLFPTQESLLERKFLCVLTLTDDEQDVLRRLGASIQTDPYSNFEAFYQDIVRARTQIPKRLTRTIQEFRTRRRAGCLLIHRVPISDALPRTPCEPFVSSPILDLGTESYLVLLAALVGEPFSYKEWESGYIVHNKYPIISHREVQFGSNAVEFLLHSETPFRDVSPDYLALLCLRGDMGGLAKTSLCDIGAVIEELSESELQILQGPFFAFETDNPVVEAMGKSLTLPMPIVTARNGERVFEYVHDLVAVTEESQGVLGKLKVWIEASKIEVFLTQGDLFLINNSHMVHGRSAYEPKYDGSDRWLQRLLLSTRLFQEETEPKSRLIPDKRLEHYPTAYRRVLESLQPTI